MQNDKSDYEQIKKDYGEKMAQLCRTLFPTILETPGLLISIMKSIFAPNHFLYNDIIKEGKLEKFKDSIYTHLEAKNNLTITDKSVKELLALKGYKIYECKDEKDIQKFKKYYAEREQLCTFNGGRLSYCYVFFAVRDDAEYLKREDFKNPDREDEYGTSVISIQFTHGKVNTLSIKNRYNHKVPNPDATFGNNLDNIVPGLTYAFEHEYNLNINQYDTDTLELKKYTKASNGKLYKYNYEINDVYYCPDNIIIDRGKVIKNLEKEKHKFLLLDYFLIDLQLKTIELYDKRNEDSFPDAIKKYTKLEIVKDKETKTKKLIIYINNQEPITITIDSQNRIIGYKNNNLLEVGNNFLGNNETLKDLEANNLKYIKDNFCKRNQDLTRLSLPNTVKVGHMFIESNKNIEYVSMPHLKEVGNYFLACANKITNLTLEELEIIKDFFIMYGESLKEIHLPKVIVIGDHFLNNNGLSGSGIKEISLPSAIKIGNHFMNCNKNLSKIYIPYVEIIGDCFLYCNNALKMFFANHLKKVGSCCLFSNEILTKFSTPNIEYIGDDFLYYNIRLWATFSKLISVGRAFLFCNEELYTDSFASLKSIKSKFLPCNKNIMWNHFPLITRYKILRQKLIDGEDYRKFYSSRHL